MAAPKTKTQAEQADLRITIHKLARRGYRQTAIAKALGITQGRVSQVLAETVEEWRARMSRRYRDVMPDLIRGRLDELREKRAEAWERWEASKGEVPRVVDQESGPATTGGEPGSGDDVTPGAELRVIREVREVGGQLPDPELLDTILACLQEEARLQGMTA